MSNDDYDDDFEESTDDDSSDDSAEGEAAPAAAATPASEEAKTLEEEAEGLSPSAKEDLRRELEDEVARFLAQGGRIQQIDPDVTADPPRKPESNYGSKPISG